jgi:hypothetical protein
MADKRQGRNDSGTDPLREQYHSDLRMKSILLRRERVSSNIRFPRATSIYKSKVEHGRSFSLFVQRFA